MTFESARKITLERFGEVLTFLSHVSSLEPAPGEPVSQDLKIMRGLFFVMLYGAMEKCVTNSTSLLLIKIKTLQPKNEHVILPFNVVSMAKKWKAVKDSGYKQAFIQMTQFFRAIEANECHGIEETIFDSVLQNIWAKTIDEILGALGISAFALSVSDRVLVDELVEKRNAIAHGRESASSVGERYRCDDLRRKLSSAQSLMNSFIDVLESYFDKREFVRPANQALYA